MFKGQQSISFTTKLSKEKTLSEIENSLTVLGNPMIIDVGRFTISPSNNFNGFAHETVFEGTLSNRDGKVNITLNYECKLNVLGWIILAIGFFAYFLGCLILLFPYNAKKDTEKKVKTVLQEIKFQIGDV
jgi:hypothetical protein